MVSFPRNREPSGVRNCYAALPKTLDPRLRGDDALSVLGEGIERDLLLEDPSVVADNERHLFDFRRTEFDRLKKRRFSGWTRTPRRCR
jgi:hypothetical protein